MRINLSCLQPSWRFVSRFLLGALIFSWVSWGWTRATAIPVSPAVDIPANVIAVDVASIQVEQGREFYRAGRYAEAIAVWSVVFTTPSGQINPLQRAIVSSYLSLAYQQLGQLEQAAQAIEQGQQILQPSSDYSARETASHRLSPGYSQAVAQLLNTQGSLYFKQGQAEAALNAWEQATALYAEAQDEPHRISTLINQAQAQQALGLYLQAQRTLIDVERSLQHLNNPPVQVTGLNSLGNVLRLVGDLEQSRRVLHQALVLAQQASPQNLSLILLSLGNTARSQGEQDAAIAFYQQAATANQSATPLVMVQTRLNQLSLLIETDRSAEASALVAQIQPDLVRLSASRAAIYAQINFADSLTRLAYQPTPTPSSQDGDPLSLARFSLEIASLGGFSLETASLETASLETATSGTALSGIATVRMAAEWLTTAIQQAKELGDVRAEAYALGHLGGLYEQTQQWAIAQRLTEQALLLAQANHALDIAYQWQWQLGRILKAQNQTSEATLAYKAAFETLQTLRSDLVAIDPSVQFSFRESVEPIYRDYVNLLLQVDAANQPDQADLIQAREVMESLQLAELTNFFRSACLEGQLVELDNVDQSGAAVLYPIILEDRLEIILSLPQQPLQRYTVPVSQAQIEATVEQFRQNLERPLTTPEGRVLGQQLYDWLIRPMEAVLSHSQVKVLVFVLDGALRNVPMAALHSDHGYLIQTYAVAIAPGLRLLNPQPLSQQTLEVLAAGLTEERHGFSPLTSVEFELQEIQAQLPSQVLLNQAFTSTALQAQINALPLPIVHLATHGQFSSNLDETFILAWDKPISIDELASLLRTGDETRSAAIELLVLSACETAAGDYRAALGLAGISVQAGARSTLASLWTVDDASGALLISRFYQELVAPNMAKAEALRRAQLALLQDPDLRHPIHWAPYVLVGNWL